MGKELQVGDIVTLQFGKLKSSNTFLIKDIDNSEVLLYHPLVPDVYVKEALSKLNLVSANLKDSTERSLDFVKQHTDSLDHNAVADLEAMCMYFVVKRKLTPRQKRNLSQMCGKLASIIFNEDVKEAIAFVKLNEGVLDDFNTMWYRNFRGLFSGKQSITSLKQRDSIFNMTGFVLAELETPKIDK